MEDDKTPKVENVPDKVLEVYQTLDRYKTHPARLKWIERRKKNWKVSNENDPWDANDKTELEKTGQIPLSINKCNKGVQGATAIVTDQKPTIEAHPIGQSDKYVSELFKRGIDFVLSKNYGQDVIYDMVEESKIGGIGWMEINYNESKITFGKRSWWGRIEMEEVAPDTLYWDAESKKKDLSDSHLIKARLRSKRYIIDNYGDIFSDEELNYKAKEDLKEPETSSGVEGADNYTIDEEDAVPGPGGGSSNKEHEKRIWEIEAWMLRVDREKWVIFTNDKDMPDARPLEPNEDESTVEGQVVPRVISKREHLIIVGKKIIVEEMDPFGKDADGNPVLSLTCLPHTRTRTSYPMSPTDFARPINQEKNKRRAQFIASISYNLNSPILEEVDSVKWEGNPGSPGSHGKVSKNVVQWPTRLTPGVFDVSPFMTLEQTADADIDDQYDTPDIIKGKIPPGQSKMAQYTVMALQDSAGMMSKPFVRRLEASLERVGKIMIALMIKHWPREMWERLIDEEEYSRWKPDGMVSEDDTNQEMIQEINEKWEAALDRIAPEETESDRKPISLLDLDVKITAGSSLPTNRMAKFQMALDMKNNGVYDAQAVLDYVDDPNADKIAKRIQAQEVAMAAAQGEK